MIKILSCTHIILWHNHTEMIYLVVFHVDEVSVGQLLVTGQVFEHD